MSHVVASSISLCDVDLRPSLYSGVVVTGGNSLTHGFVDRLTRDLSSRTPPNMRLKMLSAQGPTERRYVHRAPGRDGRCTGPRRETVCAQGRKERR